jgi:hypothetical protein
MKAHRDELTGRWHSDLPDVFDLICDKLRNREPFSFARFGDGEFNAIYGKKGANCDGHEYFPDMGKRLRQVLESKPNYIVGLQPLTLASERWQQIQQDFPGIDWVDADSIHNASIDGRLTELFEAELGMDQIVVGPSHLRKVSPYFIEVPPVNCWTHFWQTVDNIMHELIYSKKGMACVSLCASMMSEVIIHEFRHSGHTFIDLGSVLDPYAGVKSRRYHHKLQL